MLNAKRVLLAGAAVLVSCHETLPRALDDRTTSEAAPPSVPWGLEERPVSASCLAPPKPEPAAPNARIAFEPLPTPPLDNLVDLVTQNGRIYVVSQRGFVYALSSDGKSASTVLDISDAMELGYDSGLLSIAFHPKFSENGFVYLAFSVPHPVQPPPAGIVFDSVVARFHSSDGGLTIDRASEKRLLVREEPTVNHNVNKVVFGPDGYLYISAGDGGANVSPAQDRHALYGKILRLDVDSGDPYGIPPDNPFANGVDGAPEVYAYGLRNPWRFSFDPVNGDLWAGDVGQSTYEEIDKIVKGGNFGWRIKEGPSCFESPVCDSTGMIDPVVFHGRTDAVAIIGGLVYRGKRLPEFYGKYIYSDYLTARFWAFSTEDPAPVPLRLDEGIQSISATAYAYDNDGEIVLSSRTNVYRIVPPPVTSEVATELAETGCVDPADAKKPATGLFPYDVNVPQWQDGATSERFISVPGDARIAVDAHGRLELPPGSIAMRTVQAEGVRLETQFILRRPDASWGAYTYAWSPEQSTARLATTSQTIELPSGRVHQVNPSECVTCHAGGGAGAFRTIGLDVAQLDRNDVDYGEGRRGNPIDTLDHVGMLSTSLGAIARSPLPDATSSTAIDARARAYLHANCAFCHDGARDGDMNLEFSVPFPETKTCDVAVGSGGTRITPGAPDASLVVKTVRAPFGSADRMPPVGTQLVDTAGAELLEGWIRSTSRCAP